MNIQSNHHFGKRPKQRTRLFQFIPTRLRMRVINEGNKLVNDGGSARAPPRMLLLKLGNDNFGKQLISLVTCRRMFKVKLLSQ